MATRALLHNYHRRCRHLAGARLLGMPWTQARRRQLLASRVDTTVAVVNLMRCQHRVPRVLVSASAVGFYGASPNASMEPLDETAPPAGVSFSLTCALPSNMRLGAPKPWACGWCACGLGWC